MEKFESYNLKSEKYGSIHVYHKFGIRKVEVQRMDIDLGVPKQVTLEEAEEIISREIFNKMRFMRNCGIKPISPEYRLEYPRIKVKIGFEEFKIDDYVLKPFLGHRKEEDWWVLLCPPDTDFSSDLEQIRMYEYMKYAVLADATEEYIKKRGPEIGRIMGTEVPRFEAKWIKSLGKHVWSPDVTDQSKATWWEQTIIRIRPDLLIYPPEFMDFVLIHEFTHNFHHDHGKEFHEMCDRYCKLILGRTEFEIDDYLEEYTEEYMLVLGAEKPLTKTDYKKYYYEYLDSR